MESPTQQARLSATAAAARGIAKIADMQIILQFHSNQIKNSVAERTIREDWIIFLKRIVVDILD